MAVGAQRYVHLRLPEQPSVGVWLLQAQTQAQRVSRAAHAKEPAMDLQLEGKRVLITGASKGIGLAAALAFAREGASPLVGATRRCARGRRRGLRPDRHARRLRGAGPGTRRRAAGTAAPGRPVDILVNAPCQAAHWIRWTTNAGSRAGN